MNNRDLLKTSSVLLNKATELGADRLIYQGLDDLIDACQEGNTGITRFDTSCAEFDGLNHI